MGKTMSKLISLVVWITGALVSLAVGFGMAQGALTVPWLTNIGAGIATVIAGWIVVILTVISVILAIVNRF